MKFPVEKLIGVIGRENVLTDEPMSLHTTFKIGGRADVAVLAKNNDILIKAIEFAKTEAVPYTVIGFGSNLLVGDNGIRGMVIILKSNEYEFRYTMEGDTALAYVDAGVSLAMFAKLAAREGFRGTEFAAGIPGSVGGGVAMNAGAYGGEIKDILEGCEVYENGEIRYIPAEDLELSYRNSRVIRQNLIVTRALFRLEKGNKEESLELINEFNGRRRDKQPLDYPSAGSTFKRPEGYFAGKLIQDAGLRGACVGGAMVSEKHCGFVINTGNATAKDVCELIKNIQDTVLSMSGVRLETEVRMLGEF